MTKSNLNRWCYQTLKQNTGLIGHVSLRMHYDALAEAYKVGDLDFVALMTEAIQSRLHGPSVMEIRRGLYLLGRYYQNSKTPSYGTLALGEVSNG
jgi:hypothetical protein